MISISPWFERSFRLDLETRYFPLVLERLHGALPRIYALVDGVSDEALRAKPGGEWSIQEHIGHLADLESLWFGRIDDVQSGAAEMRPTDLMNRATHEAGHNERPLADVIHSFAEKRKRLTDRLSTFDEEQAAAWALHPRLKQPMRIIDLAVFVAEHDDHHLATIRQRLNQAGG